jgi:hypothetical protein
VSAVMEHPPVTSPQSSPAPPSAAQLAAVLAWLWRGGYGVAAWQTVGPDGERDLCPIDDVWLEIECAGR